MRTPLVSLLLMLAASIPISCFAQSPRTIAVTPAHPTTDDSITVVFTPAPGDADLCPLSITITKTSVGIFSGSCPNQGGTPDRAELGKLPAGTYEVTWDFQDNFENI